MKETPRIHIVLRRSKRLGLFVLTAAVLTAVLLWTLPIPWWLIVLANVLVLLWTYFTWQIHVARKGRRQPLMAFTLRADGSLLLEKLSDDPDKKNIMKRAALQDGCYVGNSFVTLLWCEKNNGVRGKAILLPDMMDEDEWRKLKILLRYTRANDVSESVSGAS